MKLNEYQLKAHLTASDVYKNIVTASTMGLCCEAAEVADLIHKSVHHGKVLDHDELRKELGDTLWNLACLATFFKWDLGEIAEENLEKLRKRHGDSYNSKHYTDDVPTVREGAPIVAGEE
jgi:NTP pyrophosphatase (non-canonical NTP hydrolase)